MVVFLIYTNQRDNNTFFSKQSTAADSQSWIKLNSSHLFLRCSQTGTASWHMTWHQTRHRGSWRQSSSTSMSSYPPSLSPWPSHSTCQPAIKPYNQGWSMRRWKFQRGKDWLLWLPTLIRSQRNWTHFQGRLTQFAMWNTPLSTMVSRLDLFDKSLCYLCSIPGPISQWPTLWGGKHKNKPQGHPNFSPNNLENTLLKTKPNCPMKGSWNWFRNVVRQCHFPSW